MVEQIMQADEFFQRKLHNIINEFIKLQAQTMDRRKLEQSESQRTGIEYIHPITNKKFQFDDIDNEKTQDIFKIENLSNYFKNKKDDATFMIKVVDEKNEERNI